MYLGLQPSTGRRVGCTESGSILDIKSGRVGAVPPPLSPALLARWICGGLQPPAPASVLQRWGVWRALLSLLKGIGLAFGAHGVESGDRLDSGDSWPHLDSWLIPEPVAGTRAGDAVISTLESSPSWELVSPPPNHMFCDAPWKEGPVPK